MIAFSLMINTNDVKEGGKKIYMMSIWTRNVVVNGESGEVESGHHRIMRFTNQSDCERERERECVQHFAASHRRRHTTQHQSVWCEAFNIMIYDRFPDSSFFRFSSHSCIVCALCSFFLSSFFSLLLKYFRLFNFIFHFRHIVTFQRSRHFFRLTYNGKILNAL